MAYQPIFNRMASAGFDDEEERRRREEEERQRQIAEMANVGMGLPADLGQPDAANTVVSTESVKTYGDGSQTQTVKTEIPAPGLQLAQAPGGVASDAGGAALSGVAKELADQYGPEAGQFYQQRGYWYPGAKLTDQPDIPGGSGRTRADFDAQGNPLQPVNQPRRIEPILDAQGNQIGSRVNPSVPESQLVPPTVPLERVELPPYNPPVAGKSLVDMNAQEQTEFFNRRQQYNDERKRQQDLAEIAKLQQELARTGTDQRSAENRRFLENRISELTARTAAAPQPSLQGPSGAAAAPGPIAPPPAAPTAAQPATATPVRPQLQTPGQFGAMDRAGLQTPPGFVPGYGLLPGQAPVRGMAGAMAPSGAPAAAITAPAAPAAPAPAQVVSQPAWMTAANEAGLDFDRLMAVMRQYPESVPALRDKLALALDSQRENNRVLDLIDRANKGDARALNTIQQAMRPERGKEKAPVTTADYIKAYMYARLGLTELASQAQRKILGQDVKYERIQLGNSFWEISRDPDTGRIVGARDADGTVATQDTLNRLRAEGEKPAPPSSAQAASATATRIRDSEGREWSQVPTPQGMKFFDNEGKQGTPKGRTVPIAVGSDLEIAQAREDMQTVAQFSRMTAQGRLDAYANTNKLRADRGLPQLSLTEMGLNADGSLIGEAVRRPGTAPAAAAPAAAAPAAAAPAAAPAAAAPAAAAPAAAAPAAAPARYPSTREEIQAFQRANGLTPDGIIGPQTRAALTRAGLRPTPTPGAVAPTPMPPAAPGAAPAVTPQPSLQGPSGAVATQPPGGRIPTAAEMGEQSKENDLNRTLREARERAKITVAQDLETRKNKIRESMGATQNNVLRILNTINDIATHPGLDKTVGLPRILAAPLELIPSGDQRNFAQKFKQLGGQEFLAAYNELRGGGGISEVEGLKAEQAISALKDTGISAKAFRQNMWILKDAVETGFDRQRESVGLPPLYRQSPELEETKAWLRSNPNHPKADAVRRRLVNF